MTRENTIAIDREKYEALLQRNQDLEDVLAAMATNSQ